MSYLASPHRAAFSSRSQRMRLATLAVALPVLAAAAVAQDQPATGNRFHIDVTQAPYNAKGDGVANDTQAIQAAVDACDPKTGGTIFFPNGRYLVDSVTLTRPNITLRGDGAVMVKSADVADHVFKDTAGIADGLSCYGLKFDLNRSAFKLGNTVSAFFFIRTNDLRFVDCEFKNSMEEGLKLYKTQNVIIDRCWFENIADGGVQVHAPHNDGYAGTRPDQDAANVKITRCTFKDLDDGLWGAGNGCGVQMYSTSKDVTTRDILIQGNMFYGCLRGVWSESQTGRLTERLIVQDNIFVGQYTKAAPGEPGGQPNPSAHGVGLVCTMQGAITGNSFYNIGTFAAAKPEERRTSDIAAIIISGDGEEHTSKYVRIADNIIVDDRGPKAFMEYGIIIRINNEISIGENQIHGARFKPINYETHHYPAK